MVSAELKVRFFEALDREDGNVTVAARSVGLNRNTAYSWTRHAGIRGRGKPGTEVFKAFTEALAASH